MLRLKIWFRTHKEEGPIKYPKLLSETPKGLRDGNGAEPNT